MLPDRKFYVTPNRILDPDIIADAEYIPAGTRLQYDRLGKGGEREPSYSTVSELHLKFKDPNADPRYISLSGDEADTAWKNFRLVVGPTVERMKPFQEKTEKESEPES